MITHNATVISVSSRGTEVRANISGKSACTNCALGTACGASSENLFIKADNVAGTFQPGDKATLIVIPPSRRRLLCTRVIAPLGALAITTAVTLAIGHSPDTATAAGIVVAAALALAARFIPSRPTYKLTPHEGEQ